MNNFLSLLSVENSGTKGNGFLLFVGLSGYNSDWLLPWLERVLAAQITEVLLWIVWVGANDACLPEFVHHVPLERYKENVRNMVTTIRETDHSRHSRILFLTPPPIDREMLGKYHRRKGTDRSFHVTAEYAAAAKNMILELGSDDNHLGVLDFHAVLLEQVTDAPLNGDGTPSLREYLTDGLHLGPKGYRLLYGAFLVYIEENWPEVLPKNTPLMAPWVGELEVVQEFDRKKRAENHDEL